MVLQLDRWIVFLQTEIMKNVKMSLLAGICIIAATATQSYAGNTLTNNDMPTENTAVATVPANTAQGFKLTETNKNPLEAKKLVVELRDMMGKYIYTNASPLFVEGQQPALDVNMPRLTTGIYIYNVYDEKNNLISTGKYIQE